MNARPLRYSIDTAWDAWHVSKEPTARDWLVVHYASLVKFVAGRLGAGLPRSVDTGDLVSAGVFGLMNAIDKFDPENGAKFETYAIPGQPYPCHHGTASPSGLTQDPSLVLIVAPPYQRYPIRGQ